MDSNQDRIEDSIEYNGYLIEALPQQLVADGRWTVGIILRRASGSAAVQTLREPTSNTFPSRQEAVVAGLDYGRRVIDGEVGGLRI